MHSYLLYCAKFLVTVRKCTVPPYVLTYTRHHRICALLINTDCLVCELSLLSIIFTMCSWWASKYTCDHQYFNDAWYSANIKYSSLYSKISILHTMSLLNYRTYIPRIFYWLITVGTTFYVQDVQLLSNHGYYINLCREPWQFRKSLFTRQTSSREKVAFNFQN